MMAIAEGCLLVLTLSLSLHFVIFFTLHQFPTPSRQISIPGQWLVLKEVAEVAEQKEEQ